MRIETAPGLISQGLEMQAFGSFSVDRVLLPRDGMERDSRQEFHDIGSFPSVAGYSPAILGHESNGQSGKVPPESLNGFRGFDRRIEDVFLYHNNGEGDTLFLDDGSLKLHRPLSPLRRAHPGWGEPVWCYFSFLTPLKGISSAF